MTALAALGPLRLAVLIAIAALSVVSFAVYGVDKAAARRGTRRVPEATLHLLAVLGGWPGALLGQRVFRHKTQKRPFRRVFWCTVVGNCIAIACILKWAGALAS